MGVTLAPAIFGAVSITIALTVLEAAIGTKAVLRLVDHAAESWAVRVTLAPAVASASGVTLARASAVTLALYIIAASVGALYATGLVNGAWIGSSWRASRHTLAPAIFGACAPTGAFRA